MNVGAGASGAGTSMFTPAANTSMNPFSSDPIYPSGEGGTSAMGRGYDQIASNLGTPASGGEVTQVDRFGTPTNFTPGNITPAGPLQMATKLGTPLASMGIGGLEESDFMVDPEFNDPRDKYDPYSKLDLNKDTGIMKQ
jgi:hypothetical protein